MELDPVIHAPARLRVVATLDALPPDTTLSFARLQKLLDLTAGNLITHLRKLEDAGYVETVKIGKETTVLLTTTGRAAFLGYRKALRELLGGV